jgi:protein arginine N-methyltransferase 1
MGYILLRESMLDSVIRARNKWMKPGGSMFPSHATMYFGAISYEDDRENKISDYQNSMHEWSKFSDEMKRFYNIDVSALDGPFKKEQADYYIYSSLWTELRVEHVIGQPVIIKKLDLNTCTLADAECVHEVPFSVTVPFPVTVSGYAGWFTVDFNGSVENPATKRVILSTGPEMGYTHWGQQVFYLQDGVDCTTDTRLHGTVSMTRQEKNKRLYNLNLTHQVDDQAEALKVVYEIP